MHRSELARLVFRESRLTDFHFRYETVLMLRGTDKLPINTGRGSNNLVRLPGNDQVQLTCARECGLGPPRVAEDRRIPRDQEV